MAKAKPSAGQDSGAPSANELASLLGKSCGAFQALAHDRAGATCEWKRYSKNAPWVVKVSEGERTLYYLTPQADQFEVTVVLGERATEAALAGRVRPELHPAYNPRSPMSRADQYAWWLPAMRNWLVWRSWLQSS